MEREGERDEIVDGSCSFRENLASPILFHERERRRKEAQRGKEVKVEDESLSIT